MAIAVVVDETATRAPSHLIAPQTRCLGYIGEGAVAVVAIKTVLSKVRAEDIFESVVVVIADAYAGRPAHRFQTGLLGYVGEGAVPIIFVEPIRCPRRITAQTGPR